MKTQDRRCVLNMTEEERIVHRAANDVANEETVVKTELRKSIQSRREAKGLGSVEMDDHEAKKKIELSSEEIEKINTRRERNRLSAQKCRKRRREQLVYLSQEANTIEEANGILEREIHFLKLEKEQLSRMLRDHHCNMAQQSSCETLGNYCNH